MAQTYTRQSTFSDGDTITASLFNDEYNQLVNAFAYSSTDATSTGHRHDGTAGQGGNIPKIGDLDFKNKLEVDSTNNRWGFFVEVSSAAVEQIRIQDGAIVPVTDNDIDLGTSSLEFKNLYIDGTATIDDLTVDASAVIGTTLLVGGATTLSGDVTLGNASADTLVVSALVNSNFVPESDSLWNLGSTTAYWANAYVDAVTTTGNVAVGGNLTVTGDATINGNLTFGNADTDSITIGAEIDSNLIPNTDDTYDLGSSTKEWRNLYIDGTANIDSLVADTADINAGTIDNTAIGATTASTGNFSTLSIAGTAITATAAELNIMDGVTATATEINVLDGITSTTAELNILDGVTATASELNLVDGSSAGTVVNSKAVIYGAAGEVNATTLQVGGVAITSTPAELNLLDGVTATTAELNILDGVTATTAELNILDGVTATAAELNVLDGVTAFVDEDDMSSDSATSIPSQQSVKAYVDSQVASSDTLSELTDTNITTPADGALLFYDTTTSKWIDNVVSGDVTIADTGVAAIGSGVIVNDDINASAAISVSKTALTAGTGLTLTSDTLSVDASQTQITAVGTLTSFTSTGIDDNATSTTLTIDSSNNTTFTGELSQTDGTDAVNIQSGERIYFDKNGRSYIQAGSAIDTSGELQIQTGGNTTALFNNSGGSQFYGNVIVDGTFTSTGIDDNATSTAITIDASENVGIGTTSPSTILDIREESTGGATQVRVYNTDNSNTTTQTASLFLAPDSRGTGALISTEKENADFSTTASRDVSLVFSPVLNNSQTEAMRIDSSGNVGIGESNPATDLCIRDGDISYEISVSTGDYVAISTYDRVNSTYEGLFTYANNHRWYTGVSQERMRLDSSGNLGIGTTPSTALHVKGADPVLTIQDNAGTLAQVEWVDSSDNTLMNMRSGGSDFVTDLEAGGNYIYRNAGSEQFRIDSSGRMGVGVTSPSRGFEAAAYSGQQVIAHFQTTSTTAGRISFSDANTTSDSYVGIGAVGNEMALYTGNTERVRIDSTGDVAITANGGGASNNGDITVNIRAKFGYDGSRQAALISDNNTNKSIVFDTNGSERFRITNTGNVGIGTNAPGYILDVVDSGDAVARVRTTGTTSSDDAVFRLQIGGTTANGIIQFGDSGDADVGRIQYAHSDNSMRFFTGAAEEMRLENDGDLHVDGNVIAYSTTISDERLKDDVQDITGALDTVDALRGVTYTWNAGSRKGNRDYGLIAQEVEQVIPEIVHDTTMPLLGDEETVYKTVDYEKLCAVLINAVSELREEVEALKNGASV